MPRRARPADTSIRRRDQPADRHVAVGALVKQGMVLLVRTRQLPEAWQPPGGGVEERDAGPSDALVRELHEELGLTMSSDDFRLVTVQPYDFGDGTVHFYVGHFPVGQELNVDSTEIAEARWFEVADVADLDAFPATRRFGEIMRAAGTTELLGDDGV
jgi:8-oxo-dGTP pyrophosphatase MutT (NUDIX family)